jgi:KUP system potassium uptake protein
MHSLKHYKVLHEKNVILTIETAPTPRIDPSERVRLEEISATFSKVTLRFGFMESPNVPKTLAIARKLGWHFDIMSTSFFLSRRALKPAAHSGMPRWQDHLFIALSRTANDATDYFQIPTGRVVEVGTQVTSASPIFTARDFLDAMRSAEAILGRRYRIAASSSIARRRPGRR